VPEIGRRNRLLYAIGVGLFSLALAAGIVESLRVSGRLPAIDLLENGPKAYINILVARKDYDAAIEQLEMQVRMVPDDAETQEMLGNLLLRQGHPEEARTHFQQLVRLRPGYAQGFIGLGLASALLGELTEAEKCFAQAVELAPDSVQARNYLNQAQQELRGSPDAAKKGG
jgi:tetratricopeptide (TPR) repeat protein